MGRLYERKALEVRVNGFYTSSKGHKINSVYNCCANDTLFRAHRGVHIFVRLESNIVYITAVRMI